MKKILALVLAMIMVMSMTAAFAATTTGGTLDQVVKFDKTLVNTSDSSDNAGNDEVTFTFTATNTQKPADATTAPALTIESVTFTDDQSAGEGTTKEVKIYTNADEETFSADVFPALGKYVYEITETVSDEAGVNWTNGAYETTAKKFYFVVTIVRNETETTGAYHYVAVFHFTADMTTEDKTTGVTNTYSAGDLHVTKTVTGNAADHDHYFPIVVTLTAPTGKNVSCEGVGYNYSELAASGNDYAGTAFTQPTAISAAGEYTFYLKHNDTLKITNLPFGVTYTVTEATPSGYATPSISGNDGNITTNLDTVSVVNSKEVIIDTGIVMDNAPYMIVMALVLVGTAMMLKRRAYND